MVISVLQWNVWFQEDISNVVQFLKNNKADIVCLQELTIGYPSIEIKNTPDFVAKELGYNFYYKELPLESTSGEKLMLANGIFSRFPIISKKYAWINQPKSKGGYDDEYRAYVEVQLNINGRHISIGTTHMSYTHKFKITDNKRRETDQLLKELAENKKNFIFTGDLNAIPDSYTINSIGKLLNNVGPDFVEKTWTTKPFSYNGFEESELNWRLDYIFATEDIKTLSANILNTDYSDHLPVFAELQF